MTLQVEKEFKLEDFIKNIICEDLKKLIYETNVSAYFKFLTLPQYIEFLGACVDENDFSDEKQSKLRFNTMMNTYFKDINSNYSKYNETNTKWYLYKDFRCGIAHQLRPQNKIGLTVRVEATSAGNKHLEVDIESGDFLVLVLEEVCIIYEAKFDNIINPSTILYHLSIQEYENKIINNGLVPKSKSKLSKHLDRIYLCEDVQYCYNLISRMKANYMLKNTPTSKINTKWIIYKVDVENLELDFYQDPNYTNGFYIVDNIDKSRIKIFDKE